MRRPQHSSRSSWNNISSRNNRNNRSSTRDLTRDARAEGFARGHDRGWLAAFDAIDRKFIRPIFRPLRTLALQLDRFAKALTVECDELRERLDEARSKIRTLEDPEACTDEALRRTIDRARSELGRRRRSRRNQTQAAAGVCALCCESKKQRHPHWRCACRPGPPPTCEACAEKIVGRCPWCSTGLQEGPA